MIGERVSVWFNDKLTVDNAVMGNYWDRKKPIPATGPIELQTHGSGMRFRNIFIHKITPERPTRRYSTVTTRASNPYSTARTSMGGSAVPAPTRSRTARWSSRPRKAAATFSPRTRTVTS